MPVSSERTKEYSISTFLLYLLYVIGHTFLPSLNQGDRSEALRDASDATRPIIEIHDESDDGGDGGEATPAVRREIVSYEDLDSSSSDAPKRGPTQMCFVF